MTDVITERTPLVIAAEINIIKRQTGEILLNNAIEIGRRLTEVKDMLQHGEWLKWLEESVSYSQRTAQKLMRVYEEYGLKEPAPMNAGADSQSAPIMNYSQALILLGIPEEERAQFIVDMDIKNMSARELQKAVKERDQAVEEKDRALQEKADLRKDLDDQVSKITRLTAERDDLKTKAEDVRESQAEIETKAGNLQSELTAIKQSTSFEAVQRLNKTLTAAYTKASANKIAFLYENLDRTFKELTWELSRIAAKDPETHEAYKKMVNDFLVRNMKERM